MGVPSPPDVASGSGGLARMSTIPEDHQSIPAPLPTGHQQLPPTLRSETDSVMETQPELEPSAAASVRSSRSMETTPDRNARQRTHDTELGNSATGVAPPPSGGWQASESYGLARSTGDRQIPYPVPARSAESILGKRGHFSRV